VKSESKEAFDEFMKRNIYVQGGYDKPDDFNKLQQAIGVLKV
jgi:hypothetical protein